MKSIMKSWANHKVDQITDQVTDLTGNLGTNLTSNLVESLRANQKSGRDLLVTVYTPVFVYTPVLVDGDDTSDGDATASTTAANTAASAAASEKLFKQEEVNKFLAEDRKKHLAKHQNTMNELEALRTKVTLTSKERDDLDAKIEELKVQWMTKDEQAQRAAKKKSEEANAMIQNLTSERDAAVQRYEKSTIIRAITDASLSQQAFNPEQIVALIQPNTRLVEALDDDNRPSGEYMPKVKFSDIDGEGKPVTLELSVDEAVKRMTEIRKYQNLFKSTAAGGLGGSNQSVASGDLDIAKLARENPEKYRQLREEGKIKF